jgi:hypothetical protein
MFFEYLVILTVLVLFNLFFFTKVLTDKFSFFLNIKKHLIKKIFTNIDFYLSYINNLVLSIRLKSDQVSWTTSKYSDLFFFMYIKKVSA